MERLLSRLERSIGRHVPAGLPLWLVVLTGLGFLVSFLNPAVAARLRLEPGAVLQGEVHRLVTFLFVPPWSARSLIDLLFGFFALQFLYTMMTALEAQWGSFRFAVFWLVGALCAMAAGLLAPWGTSLYVHLVVLLAFATLFPDYEILLFFALRVRVKWIGLLSAAGVGWTFATGSASDRVAAAFGLVNYLLFCGPSLLSVTRGARRRTARPVADEPERKPRVCAKCGRSSADDRDLEFRVCDCAERCGGRLTEYCLDHARSH